MGTFDDAEVKGYYSPASTYAKLEDIDETQREDQTIYEIPGRFFPQSRYEDSLWVMIQAKKIKNINTSGRGGTYTISKLGPTWKFLAPEEINEVHNHSFEPYDSFHSRILEKIRALHVGVDQFKQIVQNAKTTDWTKLFTAKGAEQVLTEGSNFQVPSYKIDTPMVYQSSNRRHWDLNFTLASSTGGSDILKAVKELQMYAAPDISQSDEYSIDFPWVFELTTTPSDLIKCSYAALESISPSYKVPYTMGYPTIIELSLSFEDLSPLFAQTISKGTIIKVDESATRTKIVTVQTGAEKERLLRSY